MDTVKGDKVKRKQNSKSLSETTFYLIVLASFFVMIILIPEKGEVFLGYMSVVVCAVLHFLVRKLREKNVLKKIWHYYLATYFCAFLATSFFLIRVSSAQEIPLGWKLVISAVFAGMVMFADVFGKTLWKDKVARLIKK